MKKVSVIIPAYNCEKYIKKCVDSILNQTYQNIEIIIINDGSTDNTQKICEKYAKDNSNVLLINKENEGPSIARKIGLENTKGDYISFIDSDDYIDEKFYQKLISTLESNNADIVECGYNFVNEQKEVLKQCKMKNEIIDEKSECIKHYVEQKNTTNYLWNKIYKKDLFSTVEFQKLYAGEDACVLLQLFGNSKKVVIIEDTMYQYVQTTTSLCRKPYNIKKNDSVLAGIYMYNYCKQNFPENCDYYALYICSYSVQCYANLVYSNIGNKEKYMDDMKKVFDKYYDKKNSKIGKVSAGRRKMIQLFNISPLLTSFIYKKVLKK